MHAWTDFRQTDHTAMCTRSAHGHTYQPSPESLPVQPPRGIPQTRRVNGTQRGRHMANCQGQDVPFRHVPTTCACATPCSGTAMATRDRQRRMAPRSRLHRLLHTVGSILRFCTQHRLHGTPSPTTYNVMTPASTIAGAGSCCRMAPTLRQVRHTPLGFQP